MGWRFWPWQVVLFAQVAGSYACLRGPAKTGVGPKTAQCLGKSCIGTCSWVIFTNVFPKSFSSSALSFASSSAPPVAGGAFGLSAKKVCFFFYRFLVYRVYRVCQFRSLKAFSRCRKDVKRSRERPQPSSFAQDADSLIQLVASDNALIRIGQRVSIWEARACDPSSRCDFATVCGS